MKETIYSLVISTARQHLEETIKEKIDSSEQKLEVFFDCPKHYHLEGLCHIPNTKLVVTVLSIVHLDEDSLGNYFPTYVDVLLCLLDSKRNNPYVCYSSSSYLQGRKTPHSTNSFWKEIKGLTGFGKEERDYFNSCPELKDDPNYWEKCMLCSQGIKRYVGYSDCLECDNLCKKTLGEAIISLKFNSTDDFKDKNKITFTKRRQHA